VREARESFGQWQSRLGEVAVELRAHQEAL
jgi:hypothetical protein